MEDQSRMPNQLSMENSTDTFLSCVKLVSAIYLSFMCVIGLYGNIMSAVVFSRPTMRSSINFLLASLSVTDAAMLIFVFFVLVLPNFNVAYPSEAISQFYPRLIPVLYPFCMMAQTFSVWTFVLASIERQIAVSRPLHRHKLMTMNQAKIAQSLIFVCGMAYNVIRFWEYRFVTEDNGNVTGEGFDPALDLAGYLRADPRYFVIYSTSLFTATHFLIPFIIIIASHASIFRSLKHAKKQFRNSRSERNHIRTTTMILIVTTTFVCFNTLPLISNLWETIDPTLFNGPWMNTGLVMTELANCLSITNAAGTFIIYLVHCKKYRRLFSQYTKCVAYNRASGAEVHSESASAASRRLQEFLNSS